MGFESQVAKNKKESGRGRRGIASPVVVTQSYKASAKAELLAFRVSADLLSRIGLSIGDKAEVFHDSDTGQWMIKNTGDGIVISGKDGASMGGIRYTLKAGHARLTNNRGVLPMKAACEQDGILLKADELIIKALYTIPS